MTRFIAFVSGKGGVGKTTAAIAVSQALHNLDKKTILIDANLVTPNIGLHLGILQPRNTLNRFLRKEKELAEITHEHESGLSFIPASPSYTEFQKMDPQKLSEVYEHLDGAADFVIVDAPSGLGYEVSEVLKNSDEVLLVVTPTLSSVIDALKTIELAKAHHNLVLGVVLNMSNKGKHELSSEKVEEILGQKIIANIPFHHKVRKALHRQAPVNYLYRWSKPAREFKKVAQQLCME
ncbi:MAG: P-loop NTPase [Nanoarchaeota archaeon]